MWHDKAGQSLCRAGRWREAVPVLRQLDVLQPNSKRTLFYLSAALANSGRLDEAQAPLEQARRLAPKDAIILEALKDLERSRRERAASQPAGEGGG